MAVDKDTVLRIARLARIRIGEDEAEALTGELSNILDWVEQLGEVDTEGVAPMTSVVADGAADARGRGDRRRRCRCGRAQRAGGSANGFYLVPKVVDG